MYAYSSGSERLFTITDDTGLSGTVSKSREQSPCDRFAPSTLLSKSCLHCTCTRRSDEPPCTWMASERFFNAHSSDSGWLGFATATPSYTANAFTVCIARDLRTSTLTQYVLKSVPSTKML